LAAACCAACTSWRSRRGLPCSCAVQALVSMSSEAALAAGQGMPFQGRFSGLALVKVLGNKGSDTRRLCTCHQISSSNNENAPLPCQCENRHCDYPQAIAAKAKKEAERKARKEQERKEREAAKAKKAAEKEAAEKEATAATAKEGDAAGAEADGAAKDAKDGPLAAGGNGGKAGAAAAAGDASAGDAAAPMEEDAKDAPAAVKAEAAEAEPAGGDVAMAEVHAQSALCPMSWSATRPGCKDSREFLPAE